MLTLISGGELLTPAPAGRADIVSCGGRIAVVGAVNAAALDATGIAIDRIDASGCVVIPGLIDPHQHLIGGSGERGYNTQTPEVRIGEIVEAGITTVVGCLGVDTTTRTMPALLARAKALQADGVTAFIYTGGYNVPPTTLTGSVRTDLMFVAEVIGAGEVAISDCRSTDPTIAELSRLVRDAANGGRLSGKAGVTHFHVGDEPSGLAPLRRLLDDCHIDPELLYPTHVERREPLMREAVELTKRGVTIDVDVVERDLSRWLRYFMDHDGVLDRLTASSDASITSPVALLDQVRQCVRDLRMPLDRVLPMVTSNTARVLKLACKGRIAVGADADLAVLTRDSLELRAVVARGRVLMKDGRVAVRDAWLDDSDRSFSINGKKTAPAPAHA